MVCFSQLNSQPPTLPGEKIDHFRRLYYIINNEGRIISDKIIEQKERPWLTATIDVRVQMATNFPFIGQSLIVVSKAGHIFSAWSKHFLIMAYNTNSRYQRAFYYGYKNVPLTREAAMYSQENNAVPQGAVEYRQRVIEQNNLPDTWPALDYMLIEDQSRLWVATIVDDQNVYQWWVLDAGDGHVMARFTWSRDKLIEVVRGGKLYTRKTEEETGLQRIVRYDITMTEQ